MSIVLISATAGSPGGTTLAVGLALTWPRPVVLVDADPSADQAILAGYLAGQGAGGRGLLRVAEAHRDGRPLREVIVDQCLPLAEDDHVRRLFLPGFSTPTSADHFAPVWTDLADALDGLGEVGMDVIVDTGRCAAAGPAAALVDRSAAVLLTVGSGLRSVLSARVHAPTLVDLVGESGADRLGLAVVGEGRPYTAGEVGRALGLPVRAALAWDTPAAAHLSDGQPRPRRFETSPLVRGLRDLASGLTREATDAADLLQRSA